MTDFNDFPDDDDFFDTEEEARAYREMREKEGDRLEEDWKELGDFDLEDDDLSWYQEMARDDYDSRVRDYKKD